MNPDEATLERVIRLLEACSIPYMLTGSVATTYYGRPRATHDADIVIDPTAPQLDAFVSELAGADFLVNPDSAKRALRDRSQFNAIETSNATKIDLIVRKDRPFSREEFARRRYADLPFANTVAIVTPEDAILSKLEWARRSGDSARQLADAASVVAVSPDLDRPYIARWANQLGVSDLWQQISSE